MKAIKIVASRPLDQLTNYDMCFVMD